MTRLRALPKRTLLLIAALFLIGVLLMTVPGLVEKKGTDAAVAAAYSPDMTHIIKQMVTSLTGDPSPRIYLTQKTADTATVFATPGTGDTPDGASIAGVAVFCTGGADASLQLRLCEMLKRTFSISAAHIYIDEKQMEEGETEYAVVG